MKRNFRLDPTIQRIMTRPQRILGSDLSARLRARRRTARPRRRVTTSACVRAGRRATPDPRRCRSTVMACADERERSPCSCTPRCRRRCRRSLRQYGMTVAVAAAPADRATSRRLDAERAAARSVRVIRGRSRCPRSPRPSPVRHRCSARRPARRAGAAQRAAMPTTKASALARSAGIERAPARSPRCRPARADGRSTSRGPPGRRESEVERRARRTGEQACR